MRKKSIFLIILSFLLGAVSCNKENTTTDIQEKIPITVSPSSLTKTLVEGETVPDSYTIYLSSYQYSLTNPEESGNYFTAVPFTKSSGNWSSNPTVYWPFQSNIDFLAVAFNPTEYNISNVRWDPDNVAHNMKVNVEDGTCLNTDILYSYASSRKLNPGEKTVPLMMYHMQSWIEFVIDAEKYNAIKLDEIKINKCYAGGVFDVTNDFRMNTSWDFYGRYRKEITVPGTENCLIDGKKVFRLLLPQQNVSDFTIRFKVLNSETSQWSDATDYVYKRTSDDNIWWAGMKNIYMINFNPETLQAGLTVNEFYNKELNIDVY